MLLMIPAGENRPRYHQQLNGFFWSHSRSDKNTAPLFDEAVLFSRQKSKGWSPRLAKGGMGPVYRVIEVGRKFLKHAGLASLCPARGLGPGGESALDEP